MHLILHSFVGKKIIKLKRHKNFPIFFVMIGGKLLLFVLLGLLAVSFASSPELFLETLATNREEFREITVPLLENLLGEEKVLAMDSYIQKSYALSNSTGYMVPMSDGVELYTVVNFPIGYDGEPLPFVFYFFFSQKINFTNFYFFFSVVFDRTPYDASAYQYIIGSLFHHKGYIAVAQDMRGRYKSQGVWSYWRKSPSDGYDSINWITQQPWSNGEVMAFGISGIILLYFI